MENLPHSSETNNQSTDWDNMTDVEPSTDLAEQLKGTDFELSPDTGEQKEVEIAPDDYEKFANTYLTELFNALENPVNADDANQEAITDQIAVVSNLFNPFQGEDLNNPQAIFQNITNTYDHLAEIATQSHQTRMAETHHRHANAVARMAESFQAYIDSKPQADSSNQHSQPSATNGAASLPGDVIS